MKQCLLCVHYCKPECRFNPPHPSKGFPVVHDSLWCGKWQEIPERPQHKLGWPIKMEVKENASEEQKATAGDGDSQTSPGKALQEKPGAEEDEQIGSERVCENERKGLANEKEEKETLTVKDDDGLIFKGEKKWRKLKKK